MKHIVDRIEHLQGHPDTKGECRCKGVILGTCVNCDARGVSANQDCPAASSMLWMRKVPNAAV